MTTAPADQQGSLTFLDMRFYDMIPSPGFEAWLAEQRVSLALTCSGSRLFLIGLKPDQRLSVFDCSFDRCLGLVAASPEQLHMVTRYQIWRLENALQPGQQADGEYDRLYIPQVAYTTGGLNIHDLAIDARGRVLFVNTLFNCLATVSEHNNFTPLWQPPFISQLARGNRCHLNGLALRDGQPAYMTSASRSDTVDGWRDDRRSGGAVTDIIANEVVVTGLSMPDSPRWYRDTLWLTNSGNGEFGRADLARGRFEPIVTGPGIVRGLCFVGDWAIVGVSKPRSDDIYAELALGDRLRNRNVEPRCGLLVIDLRRGAIVHSLFFEGKATREVFDVVALPGVRRPMAVGFANDAIQEVAIAGPPGQL